VVIENDHGIEGISVFGTGGGNKTEIDRKAEAARQNPFQPKHPKIPIKHIFALAAARRLNHNQDIAGCRVTPRERWKRSGG
jgi:hypothetical protein